MSDRQRWMFVGLGNPGPQYFFTRHNVGFLALDAWAEELKGSWSSESSAEVLKLKTPQVDLFLVKPQTYMNRSGDSVQPLMAYYKIPVEQLVVLHDEVDLPFSKMRFHKNRGAGGHNGVRSINDRLGSQDYIRLKLGVGRPSHPDFAVADYVLQAFSNEEKTQLPAFLGRAREALKVLMEQGLQKASTQFNG